MTATPDMDVTSETREQVARDLRQAAKMAADAIGEILQWSYMLDSDPDAAMKSMGAALRSGNRATGTNRNRVKADAAQTALTILAPDLVKDCHAKRQAMDVIQAERETRRFAHKVAHNALALSGALPDDYALTDICSDVRKVCDAAVEFAMDKSMSWQREREAIKAWRTEHGVLADSTRIALHKEKIEQYFPQKTRQKPEPVVTGADDNVVSVEFSNAS